MEKILRKAALVSLQLEVVLVFGKILGHRDEFVPDLVPHVQRLVSSGTRLTRSLILRLARAVKTGPDDGKQNHYNDRKRRRLHRKSLRCMAITCEIYRPSEIGRRR